MNKPVKKRVLIVEDEISVCRFLRATLEAHQYEIREESSGAKGIQAAIEFRPDIVILDLGLPDMQGQDVLQKIRSWSSVPVLILTAVDADEAKVKALDAGADDYLTKPFSVPELLARIRVALRHSGSADTSSIFVLGPLSVDLSGHVVKVLGETVRLTATEHDILKVLVRNAGKVVTHRTLLKEIWGPNSVEHTQYLRVYVGQLRKKLHLSEAVPEIILTEPGIGYRLFDPGQ
jgi:two-component system KDP operon response regulator KdpE